MSSLRLNGSVLGKRNVPTATVATGAWNLRAQSLYRRDNIWPRRDPDAVAFAATSGATDVDAISDFVKGVKRLGLWGSMVCWPLRSTQNAGTGTTAYSLGGLGAHSMTLVNGPTWGSNGLTMTTSHHGHVADFLGGETITAWVRRSGATPAANARLLGQWDFAGNKRSWNIAVDPNDAAKMTLFRDSVGDNAVANVEWFSTNIFTSTDTVISAQWVDGGGRAAWYGATQQSLTPFAGYANLTTRLNTDAPVILNAAGVVGAVAANASGVYVAVAIVRGPITTAQHQLITGLIAAL